MLEHPPDATLKAYLHGRLPPGEAASLDLHVESCELCGTKLAGVGGDTFSELIRSNTKTFVSDAADDDLPPELRNHPRYEIECKLGSGGMGVVYRARHRLMNRIVAVKVIRRDLLASPAAVDRFRREVQSAAKLASPYIVTAYDADDAGGLHLLVMEFVEGRTLDRVVAKKGPLPLAIACHLARQAAIGLDHAHTRGMVHRDIKPQNLIVNTRSKLKILDFGLALCRETKDGTRRAGTLLYAAPEQLKNASEVDARADQYGLGATLAFLLSGEPDAALPDTIPVEVRKIVSKLMADDPEERFPNAKAVADALAPHCSTSSATRNRWPWFAAAAVAVVTLGILLFNPGITGRSSATSATSVTSATSATSIVQPLRSEPWQQLLPIVDPQRHAVEGNWSKRDGGLHVTMSRGARIALPVPPGPEYDFRIRFSRWTGRHSVGAILVHGGRQCTFELDAWEEHLAGFQNINGLDLRSNPTRRERYGLENGKQYDLLLEVRRGRMRAVLNGAEVVRHDSDGSDLEISDFFWRMPNPDTLGLLAWESDVLFHEAAIRTLQP